MGDLDEKLLEVIEDNQYIDGEFLKYASEEAKQEAVARIRQAFVDAGWLHIPNLKTGDFITVNGGTVILNGDGTMTRVIRLTGQEWYDRFEKKLRGIILPYSEQPHDALMAFNLCEEAAKKAAGIE